MHYDFASDGRLGENQGCPGYISPYKVITISIPTATGEDFVGHLRKAAAAAAFLRCTTTCSPVAVGIEIVMTVSRLTPGDLGSLSDGRQSQNRNAFWAL